MVKKYSIFFYFAAVKFLFLVKFVIILHPLFKGRGNLDSLNKLNLCFYYSYYFFPALRQNQLINKRYKRIITFQFYYFHVVLRSLSQFIDIVNWTPVRIVSGSEPQVKFKDFSHFK
jgi:hypothetical protein